ncbi:MAG: hypothetical protein JO023_01025 [Chloroflexi bacterium]|nr:hypothetical protein [Chloroflexota bacterium]
MLAVFVGSQPPDLVTPGRAWPMSVAMLIVGWVLVVGATATLATLVLSLGANAVVVHRLYPLALDAELFDGLLRAYVVAMDPVEWPRLATKVHVVSVGIKLGR